MEYDSSDGNDGGKEEVAALTGFTSCSVTSDSEQDEEHAPSSSSLSSLVIGFCGPALCRLRTSFIIVCDDILLSLSLSRLFV